jgi:hypothetical protein
MPTASSATSCRSSPGELFSQPDPEHLFEIGDVRKTDLYDPLQAAGPQKGRVAAPDVVAAADYDEPSRPERPSASSALTTSTT